MLSLKHRPIRYASLPAAAILAITLLAAGSASAATVPASVSTASHLKALKAGPAPAQAGLCFVGPCGPPTIQASWQNDANDELGTITVRGTGFTPGDAIDITIETGDSTYDWTVTASPNEWIDLVPVPGGRVTVTQTGVACGGDPYFYGESFIYAFDNRSRAEASVAIPTPCP